MPMLYGVYCLNNSDLVSEGHLFVPPACFFFLQQLGENVLTLATETVQGSKGFSVRTSLNCVL